MDRVSKYLFSNFISSFASLFSTLFMIMSIVFFIQIARITSFIQIDIGELFKLYLFMLPRILIFTTPIAFFVALTMSFFRLSKENESIVIFTFGYSPKKISLFFTIVAFILSFLLLFISLVMMPVAENLKDNFIEYKKTQATLNIKASEFGQKFANWLVFIEKEKNDGSQNTYENVIMYSPEAKGEKERIILAKEGEFKSVNSAFEMSLKDGKIYTIDTKYHITLFDTMTIRTAASNSISDISSIYSYWEEMGKSDKRKKDFTIYVLVSLFPLATILFAISFGIVTYRYEKGFIYFGIFGVLFIYFALIMLLAKQPAIAIPAVFLSFVVLSFIYFNKKIIRKY
ncbi:LptF/LptG family permease [Campylobacter geochelonis]|uniref:LptF/LptG family permease n=1 Tax=Campylobacter geochelonis TaxID=1780362 RepID=UPI0007709FEA|nr:LptF/LptG family permease [Campylobacter geochelonis]CZE50010.1 YjgP/YjgQ permease [Campylobacter geochelonis]